MLNAYSSISHVFSRTDIIIKPVPNNVKITDGKLVKMMVAFLRLMVDC